MPNNKYERGLPVIGNLIPYSQDRLAWLSELAKKHTDYFKVKIGSKDITVLVGKEYVRHVMVNQSINYVKKTNFELIFGKGLFTTNGEEWKKQRQLLIPLMNIKYIENCLPLMSEVIDNNLTSFLSSESNGKNIRNLFSKITFDIIMSCVIGLNYENDYEEIDKGLNILTSYVTREKYSLLNLPAVLDPEKRSFDRSLEKLNNVIYSSIKGKEGNSISFSFMGQLLKHRKENPEVEISDQFIRDNIVTVMFAGYETSALTLSFMLDLLIENEDWLDKVKKELTEFDGEFSFENSQRMPITEACLFESMRLYPAGWGFTRESTIQDKILDINVNPGDIFLISPYLTHRSSLYWHTPLKFDPNRFLGKKINDEIRQIFFPFGVGPRMCSGMNFALMEMKLILLKLFKSYDIARSGKRPIVDARATLLSKNGFPISCFKKGK